MAGQAVMTVKKSLSAGRFMNTMMENIHSQSINQMNHSADKQHEGKPTPRLVFPSPTERIERALLVITKDYID
jgi:hypothetical protein